MLKSIQWRFFKSVKTACESVTETIPLMARAVNREGKWKYLVQRAGNQVQHHQVITFLALTEFDFVERHNNPLYRS